MVVVKLGGSIAAAPSGPSGTCADVASLARAGEPVTVIHGGAAAMARLAAQLNVELRDLTAPDGVVTRYTDEATLDVLTLALAGRVKPALVAELVRHGVPALGLTGIDAHLVGASRRSAVRAVAEDKTLIVRDDHGGRITRVDAAVLRTLLAAGFVPVLSPPALDGDHRPVNVNADRMAAAVAAALGARCLVFLTAAPGVLRDPADPASLVATYVADGAARTQAVVSGGMGIKLAAAREALAGGVERVVIADGLRGNPLHRALAGDGGTEVTLAG